MVRSSSAQGIRPYAREVCTNHLGVSLSRFSPLPLFSNHNSSVLLPRASRGFVQNTGGGYIPPNLLLVFKDFRTFTPSGVCEGLTPFTPIFEGSGLCKGLGCPAFSELACRSRVIFGGRSFCWCPVGVPLEPRCTTTENAPYLHSVHIVTRLFLSQQGGYTPLPLSGVGLVERPPPRISVLLWERNR